MFHGKADPLIIFVCQLTTLRCAEYNISLNIYIVNHKKGCPNHDRDVISKIKVRLDLRATIMWLTVVFKATWKCCSYKLNDAIIILRMSIYLFF